MRQRSQVQGELKMPFNLEGFNDLSKYIINLVVKGEGR